MTEPKLEVPAELRELAEKNDRSGRTSIRLVLCCGPEINLNRPANYGALPTHDRFVRGIDNTLAADVLTVRRAYEVLS